MTFGAGGLLTKLAFAITISLIINFNVFAQVDTSWVRAYNQFEGGTDCPVAIDVDNAGNVYVTGASRAATGGANFNTIKYNSNGDTSWLRSYGGGGNYDDSPVALKVDAVGNVYVAGFVVYYPGGYDYIIIKYLSNGDIDWIRPYENGNIYGVGQSLVLGGSGNIYLTGYATEPHDNWDLLLIKYRPDGDTAWIRSYNGPANGYEAGQSMCVDNNENIIITGIIQDSLTRFADILTVKFDSSGNQLWAARYNGATDFYDSGRYIAVDRDGAVYVAAISPQYNSNDDILLIKYNADGDTVWTRLYDGSAHMGDFVTGLGIDYEGNIIISGLFMDGSHEAYDGKIITLKYDSEGNIIWQRIYGETRLTYPIPSSMCLDAAGNIYITGKTGQGLLALKYYSNGDSAWSWTYIPHSYGGAIVVDAFSNVYLTGRTSELEGQSHYLTIKLVQTALGTDDYTVISNIDYNLNSNYPNPFNPSTTIKYSLSQQSNICLSVYNLLGQKVATLFDGSAEAGEYSLIWNARDMPSGIYFARLTAAGKTSNIKMVLMK